MSGQTRKKKKAEKRGGGGGVIACESNTIFANTESDNQFQQPIQLFFIDRLSPDRITKMDKGCLDRHSPFHVNHDIS